MKKLWLAPLLLACAVTLAGCGQSDQTYAQENLTQNTVTCTPGNSVLVNNQQTTCPQDGKLLVVRDTDQQVVYQGGYAGYYNHVAFIPWWWFWNPFHGGYYYSTTHVYHHYTPSTYNSYATKVQTSTAARISARKVRSSQSHISTTHKTSSAPVRGRVTRRPSRFSYHPTFRRSFHR